jgi:lipid A disaccharide synthetase
MIRIQSRLPSVILANLVLGENAVPELIQEECTAERLTRALLPLLSDTPERTRQVEAFARLDRIMDIGGAAPSAKAAAIVLEVARAAASNLPQGDPRPGHQGAVARPDGQSNMARQC